MHLSLIHIADNIVINPTEVVFMAETATDAGPKTHIQLTQGHINVDSTVHDIMERIHNSLKNVGWGGF